jgi:hypothetical protein
VGGGSFVIGYFITIVSGCSCKYSDLSKDPFEEYFPTIIAFFLVIGILFVCLWGILVGFSKLYGYDLFPFYD